MSSKPQKLSDNAQQIAECYAVVFPERPGRSKALQWVNRARKAATGERGIKYSDFSEALKEAITAGYLLPAVENRKGVTAKGPSAVHGTIVRFCESAVARGTARHLLDEMNRDINNYSSQYSYRSENSLPQDITQRVRIAVLTNTFHRLSDEPLPEYVWTWVVEARAEKYLKKLPKYHQEVACEFGLTQLIHHLKPIKAFAKTARELHRGPAVEILISLAHILAGQFSKAEKLIAQVRSDVEFDKALGTECLAQEALMATLQGNDENAERLIDATLASLREGSRKRIVYADTLSFSLSTLSLLRQGTSESRRKFESLKTARKKLKLESEIDGVLLAAELADSQFTGLGPQIRPGEITFMSVLVAISSRWHKNYLYELSDSHRLWLEWLVRTVAAGEYPWLLAEALSVLVATFPSQHEYAEDIQALLKVKNVSQRHKACGSRTLTTLVSQLEPWEYSLRALEKLALESRPKKKKPPSNRQENTRRLVWQLSNNYSDYFEVTPLEQSLAKNGNWSGGRRVSLKRLREQTGKLPPMLEQDIKASSTIQKRESYGWGGGSPTYDTTPRTLFQLIGHPLVIDEFGEKIDVVEQPAELKVSEVDDAVCISIEPRSRGASYISRLDRAQQRLLVTHITAAQRRIQEAIPDTGLQLPINAQERLQDVISALSTNIQVQGNNETTHKEAQVGDPTPLLVLEPFGNTLRVRLQVEPLANSKIFFDAGIGGSVVYVNSADKSIPIKRDLGLERGLVHSMVGKSNLLSLQYDGRAHLTLDDTHQALELLEEVQEADIRCVWPSDMPLRIKARVSSNQVSLNITSGKDWFSATGTLDVEDTDGKPLSLERLFELMQSQSNSRFVRLGEGEFLALSRSLKQQLDTWAAFKQPIRAKKDAAAKGADGSGERAHALGLLALGPLLDAATVTGDNTWHQTRKRVRSAINEKPSVPSTLQAELRNYQQEGFAWLTQLSKLGAGACLADDMGLGKTLQALAILLTRATDGPAMVVAPTSVVGNWLQEAQRFAPSLNVIDFGDTATNRNSLLDSLNPFDVVIISYGLMSNAIEALEKVSWQTVVLDEAQAIKNANTQRARTAKKLNAAFRMITTGTPVQNNLLDLHSLFSFLNPALLGSEASFRKRFAVPISRDQDSQAREQLQALVAPFLLRRHKRDVLKELPARTDVTLSIKLSKAEAALYEKLRQEALESLEQSAEKENQAKQKIIVLAYLTKLRRLCCNPKLIVPSWRGKMSKLDVISETLVDIVASGHKALVFSQFVAHLKIVEKQLKSLSLKYQYLDGSTTAKQRIQRVNAFQSGEGDVFLISLSAGGTGLNLTAADYVVHLDPWWNPAVEDQATDRAHRLGQIRPVTVLRMVTSGTIEEKIQSLHQQKRELADTVLAGAENTQLDMGVLMGLLQSEST